jgi:hypothetical protein
MQQELLHPSNYPYIFVIGDIYVTLLFSGYAFAHVLSPRTG